MKATVRERQNVFLAEDSAAIRKRISHRLAAMPGVVIVGEADDADAAIDGILITRPDWAVLDVHLKHGDGTRVLRTVRSSVPHCRFIMLSNQPSEQYRRVCMDDGASHFLDKNTEFEQLAQIISSPQPAAHHP